MNEHAVVLGFNWVEIGNKVERGEEAVDLLLEVEKHQAVLPETTKIVKGSID